MASAHEAINGIIEKTRRLGHGYRNFTNYRLRIRWTSRHVAPACGNHISGPP